MPYASGSSKIVVRSFEKVPNECQALQGRSKWVPDTPGTCRIGGRGSGRSEIGARRFAECPNRCQKLSGGPKWVPDDPGGSQLGAGHSREVATRCQTLRGGPKTCLAPSCDLPASTLPFGTSLERLSPLENLLGLPGTHLRSLWHPFGTS